MAANITYRESSTPVVPGTTTTKNGPLTNLEVDANWKTIVDEIPTAIVAERTAIATLTGKTISGANNTITNVSNVPAAGITETTVQGALNGLETRKVGNTISLANGTNLNNVITSGFYRLGFTNVNAPTGTDYGQLIVSRGSDTIAQMAFNYTTGAFFVRSGSPTEVGGAGVWTAWIQQAGAGANSTITSLTGLTTALSFAQGGTNSNTAGGALISLGERTGATGSIVIPTGTTAQRDAAPSYGFQRANSTLNGMEWWNGIAWVPMGGGATGANGDTVFVENSRVVNTNYTLSTGKSASMVGPLTVATGVTLTIPTGQRLVVL